VGHSRLFCFIFYQVLVSCFFALNKKPFRWPSKLWKNCLVSVALFFHCASSTKNAKLFKTICTMGKYRFSEISKFALNQISTKTGLIHGKLLRNLSACFYFLIFTMIQTCIYLFFNKCKSQKWFK